ncbi:hypothetical protein LIMU106485_10195 [Limosilactobacillus mucosae]|jgi:hypothetical protein
MKDSLKFLQAMQEITQLEINLLDGSDTFTDVGGASCHHQIVKRLSKSAG